MHVPFNDLGRAIAPIAGDIDMAVSRVVRSGWFLRGEETTAFEREWAAYCGQRFAVACANGTDAITLAAMGIGLKSAWVVGNTCWYTAEGLYRAGVEIGFSDVDGAGRPLGIRGCHVPLFGRFPTGKELGASLYDCAQVAGWRPPAGSVCAWSMYPTKNLGALGDAGVVTTDDEAVAVAIRLYAGADYEWRRRGQLASRMDEVQAAILRVKIPFLDGWNEERRRIAGWYWAGLRADVVEPVVRPEDGVHHLFVVKCGDRHRVQGALRDAGVGYKVHYDRPVYDHDTAWGDTRLWLEGAEEWCNSVLSLPCYPGLTESEVGYVCDAVNSSVGGH